MGFHQEVVLSLLVFAFFGLSSAAVCPSTFANSVVQIPYRNRNTATCEIGESNYVLLSKAYTENTFDRREFEVHALTRGWVAVGFNNYGNPFMSGADVTIGWVASTGNVHFYVSNIIKEWSQCT